MRYPFPSHMHADHARRRAREANTCAQLDPGRGVGRVVPGAVDGNACVHDSLQQVG